MDKRRIRLILKFAKFIAPYRRKWFSVLILSGITAILSLANPYLSKLAVDNGINKHNTKSFLFVILLGGAVFLCTKLLEGLKDFFERYLKTKVNFDLNRRLFRHIQNLSLHWFRERATGEHLYKIDYDINIITDFITSVLPQAFFIFPKLLFSIAVIFYLDWEMAFFSLCLIPFLYLPPYYFSKRIEKICEDLVNNSEGIFKRLEETFSHIQLVKTFGREIASTMGYLRMLITNIRIKLKNIRLEILSSFVSELASKIIIGLIILYGGYKVIRGNLSLGTLTAIMVYLYQLMGLQYQFTSFFQTIVIGLVSCKRISEVLDEKPQVIEAIGAKGLVFEKAGVAFNNVSFGYTAERYILKNISFQINGGSHIAISGPSGCGKTTLLNLLARLYDPWEGQILIDGYDIKGLTFSSLKGQIGFSLQEPFLWNDTIENNIRYGKESASPEEIVRVAQITGIDEIAKHLAKRYATVIGENACKLSEGQKQKIAIARALIKRPKILILDEAMSSMDSASEERIISNIKNTQESLTLITVSHRLSTIMAAELVYYLAAPEMIVDKARNLFEYNKEFACLFIGQDRILA
jgi:ABC-type bacteriocin/lantibiotic exporter with double-glycine peptidase domain